MKLPVNSELTASRLLVKETQCPYCSVQCKMTVEALAEPVKGEHRGEYSVQGVPNEASQGRLCVKGMNAHQHALSGQRLLHPLIRRNGELETCSWEEAIQYIVKQFQSMKDDYGADTIGVYGGGSLTNETAYLLGKFARVAIGTKYIDYNGRFCMSAAASAGSKVFGMDRGLTFRLSDIPKASCIILAGTNIAECQPTLLPYFNQAKENGAFIIVIDPRRTATAAMADLHLQVKPGMDALLANMMLKVIMDAGLVDPHFIEDRTHGYEQLTYVLADLQLEQAAAACGVDLAQVRQAAMAYGKADTGMIMTARGVEQQTDGHLAVRHFLNLVLATGKIGKPGCGYGAITGQGNGQGGREHGQKADQLPGYRSIENEADRAYVASVWGVDPASLPGKGVSAYEMMERVHNQDIRALLVMGSNPVVSNPNVRLVEEALRKLDFLVVADMFLSETARLADLVLPVTAYLENEGTLTNLEGRVLLREQGRPSPGETLNDWDVLCRIAAELGKGTYFQYDCAEDIFNELRVASRGGIADYYGITYERLRNEKGVYWPCPAPGEQGEGLLFSERFAHPDGKAVFTAELSPGWNEVSPEFPLILTNGRVLPHYLTGVQTHRSAALAARELENFVELHPATAARNRVLDGEWVEIQSVYGSFTVRARVKAYIREDTLFVPMHWGGVQNVNRATRPELDPYCRMPGFKTVAVTIHPLRLVR
ncbi:molybdopterin oxidoreductase family protein [Paenibacillus sp. JNUCC31]|uniref:assimilatory nitrate reductase catalytic subunit NasC n=1 Tax=Paenibacillus sp. JNUCC-31 TaxID=2777983 RepID=UPI00177AFBAF|nr:molybdopterin oxidoreductase family protein [Paenibacillus sp. JNUCC-31]QOS76981.1 molybdopterin oxidoreductase family protein [Paenibacillus sp. JNUCC-31]